jgi:hypothetical protein
MTIGKSNDNGRHKVLLAADAGSFSVTTVNLAVAMAASTNALLQGLFIEDEDLLQVTGLPCTREITLTTATERPLSTERLQRSLQLVARQFEQTLQREAQALQVVWSCKTVRGRVRDIGSIPRSEAAYTIFAHRPVSNRLQPGRIAAVRKILILGNDSPCRQQALEMLLRRPGLERVELTFCDGDGGVLREKSPPFQYRDSEVRRLELNRGQLLERLAETGSAFDYAILSRNENAEGLWPFLDLLRCPVILVD